MSDPAERLATGAPAADRSRVPGPRPGPIVWDGDSERSDDALKFYAAVDSVFSEATNLLHHRHRFYGPKNIADSPGGPLNGIRVRMFDKLARINNMIDNDIDDSTESLRDSWIDCLNYAAIALLVMDGKWPGVKREL